MTKTIAERLQHARKTVGYTQNQVADLIEISRSKLFGIEKGEGSIDISLLDKLAHLYGYSLNYFLEDNVRDEEITFAFRATELMEEDNYIPAWGRRILLNIRNLEEIAKEAGI